MGHLGELIEQKVGLWVFQFGGSHLHFHKNFVPVRQQDIHFAIFSLKLILEAFLNVEKAPIEFSDQEDHGPCATFVHHKILNCSFGPLEIIVIIEEASGSKHASHFVSQQNIMVRTKPATLFCPPLRYDEIDPLSLPSNSAPIDLDVEIHL